MRNTENLRLQRMARLVDSYARVADVGCAQAPNTFLQADRLIGIDIAPASLPTQYSEYFCGTVEDFLEVSGPSSIDAIVAGEILEHLHDPFAFLTTCRDILRPGGKLVLSTPNPNSVIERILTLFLSRRFFYTCEHIFIFPQRWLIRLLELAGFTNIRLYSGGFPLPLIGLIPFPRPWCYQTIAEAYRREP